MAISYDSRLKSDVFAKTAAGVLAANGIKVRIYDALMPVPALSFATRYYECNAGIMVTASHNPAKYNGYKAYGPDGCQMTDDAAAIVYDEIQKTDVLTGAKYISFAEGVEQGLIRFVGDDCKNALYAAIEARQVRPGLCKTAGLKLVYSPLNGSGLVPVTHVLNDMGITDITIVPEQEYPNGYFTTCSYPNPEIFEALKLGLDLATKTGADLMLATDPDADRVGIRGSIAITDELTIVPEQVPCPEHRLHPATTAHYGVDAASRGSIFCRCTGGRPCLTGCRHRLHRPRHLMLAYPII